MRNLGISIYPIHSTKEKDKNYIELAHKYGFKRIFTCFSAVEVGKEKSMEEFKEIISFANSLDMEVIVDVNPEVLGKLGASYKDLAIFKEMGLYGIRLDIGFSGIEETIMTFNPQGLKIEINMSSGTKYVDNILSYKPNVENLLGCHNFYPHKYSGLGYEHFIKCSKQFKELGITTSAFVSSNAAEFGPSSVYEGLPTLEIHRDLPIVVQAKHLFATGLIDNVIIANAYASEEELKALSGINKDMIAFNIKLIEGISEIEKKIVLDELHFNRGDASDYLIRSSQTRVKYKENKFEPFNTVDIKRGDIIIDNFLYAKYAGELQVAKKDMKNSGKTNVVGRILEDEIFLLDYIEPWSKFLLKL